jgi:two-component system, LuxR family, sensor kinase FixL
VGLLRDVSAEREATAALKLERDRANAYLELNDAILLMLDADRRIVEVNARGSELLGAPREHILGRDWADLMPAETEWPERLLQAALSGGSSRERECDVVDYSGEARRIYWRCIARRAADGSPAGWLISGVDVTDRYRREEDNALAQQRFARVARLASMGEMAEGVAHEINQPLAAIATYARACDRYLDMAEPDFAEIRDAVREIGAEGVRASRIIDRLRRLVRHDGSEERSRLNVNSVIEELRALLGADARAFGARLDIQLGERLPPVSGNSIQLQQVVLNLVRNAFESLADMPAGGRQVSLATARASADEVEIRVTDSGPGISPEIADRLFHPFATTKKSGTGLGLAMSRTIVQSHGGNIIAEPASPRGARLIVRLPAVEEDAGDDEERNRDGGR